MLNIMELQAIEDKFVCMLNCNIASGNEKENEEGKKFWEEKRKRSFYFFLDISEERQTQQRTVDRYRSKRKWE